MKNVALVMALLLFVQHSIASNYYFSSLTGDDSRSAAQARNPSTPWQSLNKLNLIISTLQPGDSVLFKKGEIFYGQISVRVSGSNISKINFGSYGSGSLPVISGFTILSGWTNSGNGIWESTCNNCGINVNIFTVNNNLQALGRYPNITAANRGYLKFESHTGNNQITDNELTNAINWTGAEVVIRKNYWTLDRNYVTAHNGSTINFVSPTGHPLLDGYGYFFQKSVQTLDQRGEWFYEAPSKKLKVYFGAAGPGTDILKVGTIDTLVAIDGRSDISFSNISFEGADTTVFAINNSQRITVDKCSFQLSGVDAFNARNSEWIAVQNSKFDNTNNNAIRITDCDHSLVSRNIVKNTGIIPGMGLSNNQMYEGIYTRGTGNIVEYNDVINTGYSAITFSGDSAIVKNNFIDTYTTVLDDGGGIYGWGDYNKHGRKLLNNIILNGIGAPEGTDVAIAGNSSGIYLDDRSANVEISGNSIAGANRCGLYLHNSHDVIITSNTLFNNGSQISMVHDDLEPADPIRNVTMNNNIFFSKKENQIVLNSSSNQDDISNFGNFTSNYYARPVNQQGIIQTDTRNAVGIYTKLLFDLPGWKSVYHNDVNSLPAPVTVPLFLLNSINGSNLFNNGSFNSNIYGVFCMASPANCMNTWNSGGRLDAGALEVRSVGGFTNINTHIGFGSIQAGKTYLIKFSLLGSNSSETIGAFLLQNSAPYNTLSETKYFNLSTSRNEVEFIFTATSNEPAVLLVLSLTNGQLPFWVDNVSIREANVSVTDLDSRIKFEYNRTNTSQVIPLDGIYMDVKNNFYSGSISLAPFSSAVLMKTSAVLSTEFIYFNAIKRNTNVILNWSLNEFRDVAYYKVEESEPGRSFRTIDSIIASTQSSVSYERKLSGNARTCYRIKAFKKDGTFVYSAIRCIESISGRTITVYPNPAKDYALIVTNFDPAMRNSEIIILNTAGLIVMHANFPVVNSQINLDITQLPKGYYTVRLRSNNEWIYTKFVKQ